MKGIRINLICEKELELPFAHFELLQGVFYKLICSDKELAYEIHNKPHSKQKQFKFYCFTDICGKYSIRDKKLFYKKDISWEIRSYDDRIIDAIEKTLSEHNTIFINNNECKVQSYQIVKTQFNTDSVVFDMATPMLYYLTDKTGYSTYYSPLDRQFLVGICSNVRRKYKSYFGIEPEGDIKIEIVEISQKDKCITRYKHSMITGYYGKYRVKASPSILDFIYYTGLGAKNSMGFGTVREIAYE